MQYNKKVMNVCLDPPLKTIMLNNVNKQLYSFKLCCPMKTILTVDADNPMEAIFKIPECIEIDGQFFKATDISISYDNKQTGESVVNEILVLENGCFTLPINLFDINNGVYPKYELCVYDLVIQLGRMSCLKKGKIFAEFCDVMIISEELSAIARCTDTSANDGTAKVVIKGGEPEYKIQWYLVEIGSPEIRIPVPDGIGGNTECVTGLSAGIYEVEVEDSQGTIAQDRCEVQSV